LCYRGYCGDFAENKDKWCGRGRTEEKIVMSDELSRMMKWWVTRIKNLTWYRGALREEDITKKFPSFWTSGYSGALTYARNRNGKLLRAKITPEKPCAYGGEYAIAEALGKGFYKKYIDLQVKDKVYDAEQLVMGELKKRGFDVFVVDCNQIAVLDPKIIEVVGVRYVGGKKVKKGRRLRRQRQLVKPAIALKGMR